MPFRRNVSAIAVIGRRPAIGTRPSASLSEEFDVRPLLVAIALVALTPAAAPAEAASCLIVTVTGSQGGPGLFNGLAGPGTLVRYGEESDNCNTLRLQFDAGRGTSLRLSQVGVQPEQLNAIFFTHMHSDHVEGFIDLLQLRWHNVGPKLDVVCSADAVSPLGHTLSCKRFAAHVGDALIQSGEIAQRVAEDKTRAPGGPAELANVITFEPRDEPQPVWASGDVRVSAVRSTHMPGHASFRVDTPAGSVVIGGDAGNDKIAPPRAYSTSDQVERLAKGADVLVHSVIHPIMAPEKSSGFPAPVYYRQSTAGDLGAMSQRAGVKHLVLTHLIPPLGTNQLGRYKVPVVLTEADYRKPVEDSGFKGIIIVGTDLASVRLPSQ
jgi:ribonuclease Z